MEIRIILKEVGFLVVLRTCHRRWIFLDFYPFVLKEIYFARKKLVASLERQITILDRHLNFFRHEEFLKNLL